MDFTLTAVLLGAIAALFSGLSKTGVPGISLVGVVLMTLVVPDAKLSPGVILPLLLVGDVVAVAFYRRHTDWAILRRLFPSVAVGMVLGGMLLTQIDDSQFKSLLGWIILGLLALDLARKRLRADRLPGQWWFAAVLGSLAGFTTVVGNAAGPVMSIYLLAVGLSKDRFMGCAAWFFLLVNITKVPILGLQGLITLETLRFDLYILPGLVAGTLIGRPLLRAIPQSVFEPIVLTLAGLMAMKLVGLDHAIHQIGRSTGLY